MLVRYLSTYTVALEARVIHAPPSLMDFALS